MGTWRPEGSDDVEIPHDGVVLDEDQYDAVLFKIDDEEVWLPRSQITEFDGETVTIPGWLAKDRDLDPGG